MSVGHLILWYLIGGALYGLFVGGIERFSKTDWGHWPSKMREQSDIIYVNILGILLWPLNVLAYLAIGIFAFITWVGEGEHARDD